MKKIMFLLTILVLGLAYSVGSEERLGFRDIYLGMNAEQASYMAEKCMEENDDISVISINHYLIPNVVSYPRPAEGEKVEEIAVGFTEKSSNAAIEAIRKKYGKPSFHENVSYQNAFGAMQIGFQDVWELKGGVVLLDLMPDTFEGWPHMFAQYRIRTKAYDAKKQAELKKKPKL